LIHHFNKAGTTFSGSAKIKDLASVMIEIEACEDNMLIPYRIFVLKKDKAFSYEKEVHVYFVK
jgi:hypothetical protein